MMFSKYVLVTTELFSDLLTQENIFLLKIPSPNYLSFNKNTRQICIMIFIQKMHGHNTQSIYI